MLVQEMARQDFGSAVEESVGPTDGGRELSLLLVARYEAQAALARAREDAAMEAQDVLSQADEALVLG